MTAGMPGDIGPPWRVPLLLLAFASLFLGIDAGLARLGWSSPGAALAAVHGPLMASGFFGTVISLERAVALGRRWAYSAPLASALGALAAMPVSYTHLRAHETRHDLVCRLLLEKKK